MKGERLWPVGDGRAMVALSYPFYQAVIHCRLWAGDRAWLRTTRERAAQEQERRIAQLMRWFVPQYRQYRRW